MVFKVLLGVIVAVRAFRGKCLHGWGSWGVQINCRGLLPSAKNSSIARSELTSCLASKQEVRSDLATELFLPSGSPVEMAVGLPLPSAPPKDPIHIGHLSLNAHTAAIAVALLAVISGAAPLEGKWPLSSPHGGPQPTV